MKSCSECGANPEASEPAEAGDYRGAGGVTKYLCGRCWMAQALGAPVCCAIGCGKPATQRIHGPGGYEDYTEACEAHVEELTMDGCVGAESIGGEVAVA